MTYKGVVKDNVIFLEEGAHLPDGVRVTVTVVGGPARIEEREMTSGEKDIRQELVARMKAFGEKLTGRKVNLGKVVLEEKEELENRA